MEIMKGRATKWFLFAFSVCLFCGAVDYAVKWLTPPKPQTTEVIYMTDVGDKRKLAGVSDHIFIGKVLFQLNTAKEGSLLKTHFQVQVLENLKGNLAEKVTVKQQGGYDKENQSFLLEGDPLLKPDQIYLFATRCDKHPNDHLLIPIVGDIPLTVNNQQTFPQSRSLSYDDLSQQIIEEMKQGIQHEIPYDPRAKP
jgi:hypothetical protein